MTPILRLEKEKAAFIDLPSPRRNGYPLGVSLAADGTLLRTLIGNTGRRTLVDARRRSSRRSHFHDFFVYNLKAYDEISVDLENKKAELRNNFGLRRETHATVGFERIRRTSLLGWHGESGD